MSALRFNRLLSNLRFKSTSIAASSKPDLITTSTPASIPTKTLPNSKNDDDEAEPAVDKNGEHDYFFTKSTADLLYPILCVSFVIGYFSYELLFPSSNHTLLTPIHDQIRVVLGMKPVNRLIEGGKRTDDVTTFSAEQVTAIANKYKTT